jgi:hypothetical protein
MRATFDVSDSTPRAQRGALSSRDVLTLVMALAAMLALGILCRSAWASAAPLAPAAQVVDR